MSAIPCACGRTLERPADFRRFRCPACSRIYDARNLDWHPPQEGIAVPGEIEIEGADQPVDWYPVDWRYGAEDMDRIRWGMRRRSMEDKWFACAVGDELNILRSWSGALCYRVRLQTSGVQMVGVVRKMPDHPWQIRMAHWIVEFILIGQDSPMP